MHQLALWPGCFVCGGDTLITVVSSEKQRSMVLPPAAGLEPSSPAAPLPPADRANTAFIAELSAAANDLISDG